MTKDEAQVIWAAASEYRWRGFDHWWAETNTTTQTKDFKDDPIVNNNGLLDMLRERGYGATKCSWGTEIKGEEHRETIEWIKTRERLPEYFKDVLVGNVYGCMVANLEISDNEQKPRWHYGDYDEGYCPVEIFTHWRRLPELPKGPKEGKE